MNTQRKVLIAVLAVLIAAGLLGFTKPGKRVLSLLGFAAACDGGCD